MDGGRKCCDRQTCPTQKQQLPSSEKMFTPRQWSTQSSRQDTTQHPNSQQSTRSAERSCPARSFNQRNNSTQILFVEPNFMETPSEYDVFYDCFSDYDMSNESSPVCRVPRPVSVCSDTPAEMHELPESSTIPNNVLSESPELPNCLESKCPAKLPETPKPSEMPEKRVSNGKDKDKGQSVCKDSVHKEASANKQKDLNTMLKNLEDPQLFRGTLKQIVCTSHKLLKTFDEAIKKGKLKICTCKIADGNSQQVQTKSNTAPCSTAVTPTVETQPCASQAVPVQTAHVSPVQAPCVPPQSGQLQVYTGANDGVNSATERLDSNNLAPETFTLTIPVTILLQLSQAQNAQSPKISASPEMQNESMEPIRTAIISASRPPQPMIPLEYTTGDSQIQSQPTNNIFQYPASRVSQMIPEQNANETQLNISCNCVMCQAEAARVTDQQPQYPHGCYTHPAQGRVSIESPPMPPYACSPLQTQARKETRHSFSLHQTQEPEQNLQSYNCPHASTFYPTRKPQQVENTFHGANGCSLFSQQPQQYEAPAKNTCQIFHGQESKYGHTCPTRLPQPTETSHTCSAKMAEKQHTCLAKMHRSMETPNKFACTCYRFQSQQPDSHHVCSSSPPQIPCDEGNVIDSLNASANAPPSCPCQGLDDVKSIMNDKKACTCEVKSTPKQQSTFDSTNVCENVPPSCPCEGLDDVKSIMNGKKTCTCGVKSTPKQQSPCTCQVLDTIKSVMKNENRCVCNKDLIEPITKVVEEEVKPECPKTCLPCTCHALDDVKSPMKDEKALTFQGSTEPSEKLTDKPEPPPKPRRVYRLATPQHRELKLCTPCRYEPSPLIDEHGNVFCPYKCGCCLCPWRPRATDSQIDKLNHQKIKVCKCRDRGNLFDEFAPKETDCSKSSFFDVCPCREKAEAKYLELYGHEMWTADDKLNTKQQGREISLAEVTEIIPFTRPKP